MSDKSRELHGLLFIDSIDPPHSGMNRSILTAMDGLAERGIHLEPIIPRTITQSVKSMRRLWKSGRVLDYDFVLFNSLASFHTTMRCGYPMARLFARGKRRPFIYWHEMESVLSRCAEEDGRTPPRFDRLASLPRTVHLVASESTGAAIAARYPGATPHVIYECVPDEPSAHAPLDPPVVLTVAGVQQRKGYDIFIETAALVCKRHPTALLWWAGAGADMARAREAVREHGVHDRVRFLGYVQSPAPLIERASVVFLPSREDPFPLAVLEAMAAGRHVVTFESGGAVEAVGPHGDVIADFDPAAAAEAILRRLELPPDARANADLQARFQAMYTKGHFVERLAHVLREGVEGRI